MKKSQSPSQYRVYRQPSGLSPDLLEELKVLKALETRDATPAPQA